MQDAGNSEQSGAEVQARLAAIIESSDDAIVSKTLDGIVRTWNKGAERIFGWTAEEVVGKPITIIIPPDRLEEEPKILARLRAGERVDHFETIRQTKDGRLVEVSVTISPVRDASGRIVGASKIARDITLQKRFQRELQAATRRRRRRGGGGRAGEGQEARSGQPREGPLPQRAVARTAHAPDARAGGGQPDRARTRPGRRTLAEQVAMIRRNVETEARLVDDLLDLTRIARGKVQLHYEVVDAHAVLRNVVSMFHREIEDKGLTVAVSLRAKRFHVWADPGRFQQMLLNLLSNAVKFTPEDGTVTVRTSNENGTVKIEVIDTGVGIEPEVLPRLFRPFEQGEQTVTRKFGGLGLGLSIVKSLVEMHEASITAASDGKDTGCHVHPADQERHRRRGSPPRPQRRTVRSARRAACCWSRTTTTRGR